MFVLLEIWKGHVEKVWVSNDSDLIDEWWKQVDAEHGIVRDIDGEAEPNDWEVIAREVDQYQITFTLDNVIPMN